MGVWIAINKRICGCRSSQQVLAEVNKAWEEGVELSSVIVSTALHRTAKHSKQLRSGAEKQRLVGDARFARLSEEAERVCDEFKPDGLFVKNFRRNQGQGT